MRLPANDAIESVPHGSAPGGEKKAARSRILLSIEGFEQRDALVSKRQHTVWIGCEDLAKRFIGRVVQNISTRLRLLRFIDFEDAGDVVVPLLDCVASPLCGLVLLQLERLDVYGESACRRFILLARFGFKTMQGP